jgi:hypothetical protein
MNTRTRFPITLVGSCRAAPTPLRGRDRFYEPVMFALFERLLQPTTIPRDPEPPPGLVAFYWHFARQAKGLFAGLFAAGFALALLDGLQEEIGLKPVWVGEFRCQPLRDRDAVVEAVDSAGGLMGAHKNQVFAERFSNSIRIHGSPPYFCAMQVSQAACSNWTPPYCAIIARNHLAGSVRCWSLTWTGGMNSTSEPGVSTRS